MCEGVMDEKCGYCGSYTRIFIKKIFSMLDVKMVKYMCPRHGEIKIHVPKVEKIFIPRKYIGLGIKCELCGFLCCDYTDESYGDLYTENLLKNIPYSFLERIKLRELKLEIDGLKREAWILLCEDEKCPFLTKEGLCSFYLYKIQDLRHPACISSPFHLTLKGKKLMWRFIKPHQGCKAELVYDGGKHLEKSLDSWFKWIKSIARDLGLTYKKLTVEIGKQR